MVYLVDSKTTKHLGESYRVSVTRVRTSADFVFPPTFVVLVGSAQRADVQRDRESCRRRKASGEALPTVPEEVAKAIQLRVARRYGRDQALPKGTEIRCRKASSRREKKVLGTL